MRLPHISLRKNKDLIVVAPATANIIAKAANGIADDLVSSTLLARECPLMLCPAMNVQMWRNPATVRNVRTLKGDGVLFSGPEAGNQACGDVGEGRLREPAQILEDVEAFFTPSILSGKKVLMTAGPTFEPFDPVRGITNGSSGPTTTISIWFAKANSLIAGKSSALIFTFVPTNAVPALPGAMNN